MEKVKVAVVDDHKLFRDGIVELIRAFSGYEVTIEADNGNDLIKQLTRLDPPDIVLLDVNMKQMDGFETAQWFREHYPFVKILVLSMYENENAIIRLIHFNSKKILHKS